MEKEIYLDSAATTRPFEKVINYISEINRYNYGNPSSMHKKGIKAEKEIKKSRDIIASTLSVENKEIYFTSGGTESNNLAILGYLKANPRKGKHIITTKTEHSSVLEVFKYLSDDGYQVDYIDVDREGNIDLENLKNKITDQTALISIILVNNETGCIQSINKIVDICKSTNSQTVLHMDAVQAYGKIKIFPGELGIDMMSISSHKIGGIKGAGALYVNKSIKIKPIILGGGQEFEIRSGTENVSGICGFGMAADLTFKDLDYNTLKVEKLKKMFIHSLEESSIEHKIISPINSSPYILNISFSHTKGQVLLHHLEEKDIFVSTGSACSSKNKKYSHVLLSMGLEGHDIEGSVRFSFSPENSEKDIYNTIEALNQIIPKIKVKSGGRK